MKCQVKSLLRAKNNPYSFSGKGVVLCNSNQCLLDYTIFLSYDYIHKLKSDSVKAKPWELLDEKLYPSGVYTRTNYSYRWIKNFDGQYDVSGTHRSEKMPPNLKISGILLIWVNQFGQDICWSCMICLKELADIYWT
jgi:hypothetical protein